MLIATYLFLDKLGAKTRILASKIIPSSVLTHH